MFHFGSAFSKRATPQYGCDQMRKTDQILVLVSPIPESALGTVFNFVRSIPSLLIGIVKLCPRIMLICKCLYSQWNLIFIYTLILWSIRNFLVGKQISTQLSIQHQHLKKTKNCYLLNQLLTNVLCCWAESDYSLSQPVHSNWLPTLWLPTCISYLISSLYNSCEFANTNLTDYKMRLMNS